MTAIDLSEKLEEIRRSYPQWWRSEEADAELQALWGNVQCNQCGVMQEAEAICIRLHGHSQWQGTIKIVHAPNGWYAMAVDYSYALGGGGSPVSVWNRTAYTKRDEAVEAGIGELIRKFEVSRNQEGCAPATQAVHAGLMMERLRSYLRQMRQMELF